MKTTTRRTADGTGVRYLHLAHDEWDAAAGRSVPKILYSFGREDRLDRAAISRLVASLAKLLYPAEALAATAPPELTFADSRPYGGAWLLDQLWRRLGIDTIAGTLLAGSRGRPRDSHPLHSGDHPNPAAGRAASKGCESEMMAAVIATAAERRGGCDFHDEVSAHSTHRRLMAQLRPREWTSPYCPSMEFWGCPAPAQQRRRRHREPPPPPAR